MLVICLSDPELYTELLAPAPEEVPVPYERPRATEEELETVQRLKDWSDTTPQGLAKVKKLLEANATSAEEAGITRLGGLLAEAKGTGSALPSSCGLTPSAMCPVVMEAMSRFLRDAKVPAPPEAKKKKKSKGKKGFNEEEDLERQKHDLGLLFNNPADRAKEILETLRSDPAWREEGEAEGQAGHLQLQEAVKLLSAQLSERARQQLEREKAEAVQKMEEMELEMLKKKQEDGNLGLGQDGQSGSTLQGECRMGNALFSGAIKPEVEFWGTLHCSQANDFRKDKHSASGAPDLEKLLKDALVHGAKLSRAKKDLEEQRLELRAEVQHLQRRVATLSEDQAQHLQQKARQKERLEKLKAKIEQKQEEVDELETAVEASDGVSQCLA
eukprot:g25824.t1